MYPSPSVFSFRSAIVVSQVVVEVAFLLVVPLLLLIHTFSILSLHLRKNYGDTSSQLYTYQRPIALVVTNKYEGQRVTSG